MAGDLILKVEMSELGNHRDAWCVELLNSEFLDVFPNLEIIVILCSVTMNSLLTKISSYCRG